MVRIVSGIIALGWEWRNWKELKANPNFSRESNDYEDSQNAKEAILAQQAHWVQWIDRVSEKIHETQPNEAEVGNFEVCLFCLNNPKTNLSSYIVARGD